MRRTDLILASAAVALAAVVYYARHPLPWASREAPVPAEAPAVPAAPAAPVPAPTVPAAPPVPLDSSDSWVREKLLPLSPHLGWAGWLKNDDLVRRAAGALQALADGGSPAESAPFLVPRRKFTVVRDEEGRMYADPRSFKRYDAAVDILTSVDPDKAAAAYRELKPLLQQACGELGSGPCDFDAVAAKALNGLLAAPKLDGQARLVDKGALYAYADRRLESLTPAQKLLLRTGPRNAARLQAQLRKLAAALGLSSK